MNLHCMELLLLFRATIHVFSNQITSLAPCACDSSMRSVLSKAIKHGTRPICFARPKVRRIATQTHNNSNKRTLVHSQLAQNHNLQHR